MSERCLQLFLNLQFVSAYTYFVLISHHARKMYAKLMAFVFGLFSFFAKVIFTRDKCSQLCGRDARALRKTR